MLRGAPITSRCELAREKHQGPKFRQFDKKSAEKCSRFVIHEDAVYLQIDACPVQRGVWATARVAAAMDLNLRQLGHYFSPRRRRTLC